MISNPFANLGVATQAAEMQAEEADMALANTLYTICNIKTLFQNFLFRLKDWNTKRIHKS